MRKIVSLYSIVLVVFFLSTRAVAVTASGGKSYFAPQSLMSMLAPLSMRPQLIMNGIEPEKAVVVHLRPLVSQPEQLQPMMPSPMPIMPPLQDRFELQERPEPLTDRAESSFAASSLPIEAPQAMPLDALTIPLNDVESPDALTIPLNDIIEEPVQSQELAYDAPDLNENPRYLAPEKSRASQTNMNLGQMQLLPNPATSNGVMFAITPFYMRSNNGSDLRHYFFPNGKDELVVKGSLAAVAGAPDVSGTWLRIVGTNATQAEALLKNNFQSTLQVSPTYEFAGAHLHVHKQMGQFWSDIQLPVAQVRVNHGIKEYGMSGNLGQIDDVQAFSSGAVRRESVSTLYNVDAASALSNASMQYHKLSKKQLKHYGLGDATVKMGMNKGCAQFFTKLVFPTSQPPTNEFMFEPQLGNGGHLGVGFGGSWTYLTKVPCFDAVLGLQGEADYTYLFSNTQMRTFDITDYGAFSRYLLFRIAAAAAGLPPVHSGVNILTKKCTVSPNGEGNLVLAAFLTRKNLRCGVTYSLHGVQEESIKLSDSFSESYGVIDTVGDDAFPNLYFFDNPTIARDGAAGGNVALPAKRIGISDLDLNSATKPACATSQIAISCGSQHNIYNEDVGIDVTSGVALNHGSGSLGAWFVSLQLALKL